jgi:hypothetical protein
MYSWKYHKQDDKSILCKLISSSLNSFILIFKYSYFKKKTQYMLCALNTEDS